MIKAVPSTMFADLEQTRLSTFRAWVLDCEVTQIQMTERQFWNFCHAQPLAEKPWVTFMGRPIAVPDMPEAAQKSLNLFDRNGPGSI
jgi:hypothetical protein